MLISDDDERRKQRDKQAHEDFIDFHIAKYVDSDTRMGDFARAFKHLKDKVNKLEDANFDLHHKLIESDHKLQATQARLQLATRLPAKWRENAKYSGEDGVVGKVFESVSNQCADELEVALKTDSYTLKRVMEQLGGLVNDMDNRVVGLGFDGVLHRIKAIIETSDEGRGSDG